MEEILYSRISENRDLKFLMKTVIIRNHKQRYVAKSPVYSEGTNHCYQQLENATLLAEKYANTDIEVIECHLKNDAVIFPFIKGNSLECLLNELLRERKLLEAVQEIKRYFEQLCLKDNQLFYPNEECKAMFGDLDYPSGLTGIVNGNLDAIFSNVMYNRDTGKYTMFDYEWTLPFCIPVKYVLFRALFWYQNNSEVKSQLAGIDLIKLLNFTDREVALFLEMEDHFQNYVRGNKVPLWQFYEKMDTPVYHSLDILCYYKEHNFTKAMKVYYDLGEGFNEANTFVIPYQKQGEQYFASFHCDSAWKAMRLDPCETTCTISNLTIRFQSNHYEDLKFECNGMIWENNLITFLDSPYIVVPLTDMNAGKINVSFYMDVSSQELSYQLDSQYKNFLKITSDKNDLYVQLQTLNELIAAKDQHIHNLTNEIQSLKNSRLLKLSRKIKKLIPFR